MKKLIFIFAILLSSLHADTICMYEEPTVLYCIDDDGKTFFIYIEE